MDTTIPLLASGARTATTTSDDIRTTVGDRGAMLVLDITKGPKAADTLTFSVEVKDETSGKYVSLTAFAATKKGEEIEAGTTLVYTVYPGAAETTAVGNHEVQALPIPRHWRAKITHSGEASWTYSLGYQPLS